MIAECKPRKADYVDRIVPVRVVNQRSYSLLSEHENIAFKLD